MRRLIAALATALILAAPLAAQAQIAPSYSDDDQQVAGGEAQIHGRVLDFDGGYTVHVRDEKGYVDNVQLHQGTIINPTGLTIAPGMVVSILGYNAGDYFAANEVDTPYNYYNGFAYYGGHPWNYYGPSVSLGFFFGNAGWWHGSAFIGGPRFVGGVRYYNNNVRYNTFYRGGAYVGRNYVVPQSRGGYVGRGYERPAYARGGGEQRFAEQRGGGRAPQAQHDDRGGNGGGHEHEGGGEHHDHR